MAAAAAPFTAWLSTTAAQAEQAAHQAKAAAGAYEAAFAATVPPPVIAANRALLASLIATNILGQNTPAIAATEAHYAEMWAQDAAAMFGYAGSSAAATQLTSFTAPPTTTNGSGEANQSAAVASATQSSVVSDVQTALSNLTSQVPNTLQSLATNAAATSTTTSIPTWLSTDLADMQSVFSTFNSVMNVAAGPYSPLGIGGLLKSWWQVSISIPNLGVGIQGLGPLLHPKPITGALAPLIESELLNGSSALQPTGLGAGTVSATLGRAGAIGSLSVPTNWASAVPAVRTVAAQMPETLLDAAPEIAANAQNGMFGEMALSSLAGRALGGTATRAVGGTVARVPAAVVAEDIATTATIIVIPPSAE